MKLGPEAMEALQAEITGRLKPGDDLVVAGPVGLEGTIELIKKRKDYLRQYFSTGFLQELVRLEPCLRGKLPEQKVASFYEMGKGGVLAALWKMTEASQVGLKADLRSIPIRQETIEICERLGKDPYKLFSGGSVLIGCTEGQSLVQWYRKQEIPAALIGKAVEGNDRLLYSGEIVRYLDRPGKEQ